MADFFNKIKQAEESIDVLVNCAGIAGPTASLEDIDPDDWDQTMSQPQWYVLLPKEGILYLKIQIPHL